MTGSGIEAWNAAAEAWAGAMLRASWQGGVALLVAWVLSRERLRLGPEVRCWVWRLALLRLLIGLFWATPVTLPLLPAPPPAPGSPPAVAAPGAGAPPLKAVGGRIAATPAREPSPVHEASGLLLLWLAGIGIGGFRIGRDLSATRQLRRTARPVAPADLRSRLTSLSNRLGLRRPPALMQAEEIDSPLLLGLRHPVILLPGRLLEPCPQEELRLILAHELAHLRRRDLLWGWLLIGARILFFFHPLVWLAPAEWRLAHEMACDALAVRITGAPAATYGEVLLRVASGGRAAVGGGAIALGGFETAGTLARRLKTLKNRYERSRRQTWLTSTMLVLLGFAVLVPWRLTAQAATPPETSRSVAGGKVTMDLKGVSLRQALTGLFGPARIGYVMAPDVPNVAVTLRLNEVPFEEALRLITLFADVAYRKEGELYIITKRGAEAAAPAARENPPLAGAPVPAEPNVTVELRDVPFRQAVEEVFRSVGERYAFAPDAPTIPVRLSMRNVGFSTALRTLARLAQANYRIDGGVYVFGPGPGLPPARGGALQEEPVVKTVTMQFNDVPLEKALAELFRGTDREYVIADGLSEVRLATTVRDLEFTRAMRQTLETAGLVYHREGARRYVIKRPPELLPPLDVGIRQQGPDAFDLNLDAVTLRAALEQLFGLTGAQYAVEPDVPNAPMTVQLRGVDLLTALRTLTRLGGATYARQENIFIIKRRT